jgi:hypothetical protein
MDIVLWIIAIFIAIVLIRAAFKPDIMRIERSAFIQAPPAVVFKHVNDLKSHLNWSAWEKIDPNMQRTMGTVSEGAGATYEWNGNKEIGAGKITLLESVPTSKIVAKIEFFAPMKGVNTLEYTLQENNGGTEITHAMFGPSPFIGRIMCQFFDMEKMVGGKFAESLAALKAICEK